MIKLSNDRYIKWISLFIAFLCITNFITCNRNKQDNDEALPNVKVGITKTYLGEAATFTAKEMGYFESNGLNVDLKYNSSGSESIRDLFKDRVDMAHVAETPVVYSMLDTSYIEGELPRFQIFGDTIYSHEIQKIIAIKKSGIETAEDLRGKRIGIYKGTQLDYFFDSYLLEHQISKDSMTIIDMNPESQVEAINRGEVDVVVTWEPYATYIARKLGDDAKYLNTQLTYSTLWLIATTDHYAESNPKILEAYLKSLKEAQNGI